MVVMKSWSNVLLSKKLWLQKCMNVVISSVIFKKSLLTFYSCKLTVPVLFCFLFVLNPETFDPFLCVCSGAGAQPAADASVLEGVSLRPDAAAAGWDGDGGRVSDLQDADDRPESQPDAAHLCLRDQTRKQEQVDPPDLLHLYFYWTLRLFKAE